MTAAIGASAVATAPSTSTAPGTGTSSIALQAQLDRCNKQLGEWAACPSGKTPQGQQIIQALEQQIGTLKARITQTAQGGGTAPAGNPSPSATASAATLPPAALGTLGTLLNTIA